MMQLHGEFEHEPVIHRKYQSEDGVKHLEKVPMKDVLVLNSGQNFTSFSNEGLVISRKKKKRGMEYHTNIDREIIEEEADTAVFPGVAFDRQGKNMCLA